MKNKEFERRRLAAKRYAKTWKRWNWDTKYNMQVYHSYEDENGNPYKTKGYWDDVAFFHGSQKIVVLWTHPRYEYREHLDSIAYGEANQKFPDRSDAKDWFKPTKTNYKKLGRSRKKAVSHEMGNIGSPDGFFEFWRERRDELCRTSDFKQKCRFFVQQMDYCRQVIMCAPIEVVNVETLYELVKLTKECLADRSRFDKLYGDYEYTKDNYIKDQADEQNASVSSPSGVHSIRT